MAFVPLRVLSSFSMLEGSIEPKPLAKLAKKLGFPAVALTDRNGLYAAMAFSEAAMGEGVQPIIGATLGLARPEAWGGKAETIDWLVLLAKDEGGYGNLCKLVSKAHMERPDHLDPHVTLADLETLSEGLIALTAGGEGSVVRLLADGQAAKAKAALLEFQRIFPDRLYVEISRRGDPAEEAAEGALLDLAYDRGLPLVATNPALYDAPDFHAAHDAMLCIASSSYVDEGNRKRSSVDAWLKPETVMAELFADLPEALDNTLVVARRCAVAAPKRRPILPRMGEDEDEALRKAAHAGLEGRIADYPEEQKPAYRERLDFELDVITRMGFAGYFLIVADFIQWAKANDIPVGPGRGSGAGSAVAWALLITDLDPLALGLLFERFLNPERVSMPDFDIDFCETHRDKVIRYVQGKYGRDKVAQIITFGRLKARAVLKDTGRVLQMPYGQVDRLAKLVPNHPTDPWTLERSLNGVSELAAEVKSDAQVKRLFDLAMKLEGLPRHSSTHAAGVVIGDRPLQELVPLHRDPRSDMPVTQFDMKYVEGAGLVKFDFLGLKTLSVLKEGQRLLAKRGIAVDFAKLGWDDEAVYELLQRGDTVGVFQLESEGMRRTLAAVRPTNFGDIIALVSLYRPGPMDNIPLFGDRKNGRQAIEYPHPLLEEVLKETYGIFVYQEQVMQAAQVLAGYSLGEADLLRRAMGKKIKAEMDAQRERFVEGCAAHDIKPAKANELFDLIDKFAGYGFNKSHAAAYALVAYHTAWLKAHHPAEFFAASMSYDIHQTDKLCLFVDDLRRMGLTLLPPDINVSEADFDVAANGDGLAVRYALGALKGVGEKAMAELVADRKTKGPYTSLEDFAARVDPRLLNRRQLESLAAAGALDGLNEDRAAVHAGAETILAHAVSAHSARTSGQGGLFGGAGDGPADVAPIRLPRDAQWTLAERMANEREAFGFYFSAHPVDQHRHLLAAHRVRSSAELGAVPIPADGRGGATMAGLVEEARWRTSQRGRRFLMARFSDSGGQFDATVFDDEAAAAVEAAAKDGQCGLLSVELDRRPGEEQPRVTIKRFQPLEELARRSRVELTIRLPDEAAVAPVLKELGQAPSGSGMVRLVVPVSGGREATLLLPGRFALDAELAARLARFVGEEGVSLAAAEQLRLVG
ncbi:DNA polymerase III subunit alpha [Sphingomonas astaxanthinifaciens]|uniref:DNA polymerase III subunit alpha n=1 Tax=Sphingomonas astaxanthinifaciens DSM 22298 TaxID=1123267 RepID=A0ABQ5Z8R0_9SPHN|nr:DNA polymerase III subunit alpha [Sphingomonas astaxanthinifaciens]GLR47967.1 DNA-directed DNA polymerase [Sphingomonas astaxanthinifaciens DSM 22298]